MCGDAAGMIHPLCGNGMSMAIQSAQLAAPLILNYLDDKTITRANLEKQYIKKWQKQFKWRLKAGHVIAALFRQHTIASILRNYYKNYGFYYH
jgi:Dehydrogenases (flavoproteins)